MFQGLPGSPAKLERVERHLSRQRGAGVRNLATNFGFSLGLSIAPAIESGHPEVPSAKRRKAAQADVVEPIRAQTNQREAGTGNEELAANDQEESVAQRKPKARRRFEAVEDEATTISRRDDRRDSFSKAAKRKGRLKKSEIQLGEKEVPRKVDEIAATSSEGRPRRRAAASAMAKVTEGFAEEAAPIDKKRREPEPEKPARRGRTKVVVLGEPVAIEQTAGSYVQVLPHAEVVIEKPQLHPNKRKAKRKASEAGIKRIPLEETQANIPSKSPDKQSNSARKNATDRPSPSRQRSESPVKRTTVKTDTTKRRRKDKIFHGTNDTSKDDEELMAPAVSHGSIVDDDAETLSRKVGKETTRSKGRHTAGPKHVAADELEMSLQHRTVVAEVVEEQLRVISKPEYHETSALPDLWRNGKTSDKVVLQKSKRAAGTLKPATRKRPVSSPLELSEPPLLESLQTTKRVTASKQQLPKSQIEPATEPCEEDVEWLFETSKKKMVPSTQIKRPTKAKATRRAKSPEVDLDDLLSNIASWAPKRK